MKSPEKAFQANSASLPAGGAVVGVSGGADSMCLLDLFRRFASVPFVCAHLDHGIREDASRDAALVRTYCERYGIPFYTERADVPALARSHGQTLEQAGREARYDFLRRVMRTVRAERIAVAHHRDDQAETLLFHLIRGSGSRGLSAMAAETGDVIRPLLDCDKAALVRYCEDNGIPYATDATNEDTRYARNYLRRELLPAMARMNPAVNDCLARTAALLREDDAYLTGLAAERLSGQTVMLADELHLPLAAFADQPDCIASRMLRLALERWGMLTDIEQVHIEDLLTLIRTGASGASLSLPHGMQCFLTGERIMFFRTAFEPFAPRALCEGELITPRGGIVVSFSGEAYSYPCGGERLDRAKIGPDAVLRHPQPGDWIRPLGMQGKKMLNDYLSDRKIPRPYRERMIVLACGDEVLWAERVGIGEKVKLTHATEQICTIIYR